MRVVSWIFCLAVKFLTASSVSTVPLLVIITGASVSITMSIKYEFGCVGARVGSHMLSLGGVGRGESMAMVTNLDVVRVGGRMMNDD